MAKQDDYIRITLRLPQDVHRRLIEAAGPRSLNAEIVTRLQNTLDLDEGLSSDPSPGYEHMEEPPPYPPIPQSLLDEYSLRADHERLDRLKEAIEWIISLAEQQIGRTHSKVKKPKPRSGE
ncbi:MULTISPECIES: hypothetical protein [unclassified Chelatococcus]|uniref:hypothetical protein n=1 Tax=unclassified Chelatococcus TaxID=2638111 RepID=UPI001BCD1EEC|nr:MULTISPECIES: hypothetical protein [unclassified Chelatococcus]MBS7741421.1 hypothetical protein [Chelatococcus sp. HY11]MBX3546097.1 hypothetical protein [Chelatococcus sp.]MCO5077256.1 hypothetical protein [Chelatococcus sp.]